MSCTASSFAPLPQERHCQTGVGPAEGHQDAQGLEHQPCKGSLRDGAASAWRREGFGGTSEQLSPCYKQVTEKTEPGSPQQCMVAGGETMGIS